MPPTGHPSDNVQVVEKTTPFSGYFQVDHYTLKHRRFDGGWTGEISREVFERGHAAAVLPYDPVADRVVIIEQFRTGAFAAGQQPWLLEFVAGIIEEGEKPEEVVRRESVEEAGVVLGPMEFIGHFLVTPGGSSEMLYLYCGMVDSQGVGGYHGIEAEGEDIKVITLPFEQAVARFSGDGPHNMTAVVAMQWLQLNRDRLRAAWAGSESVDQKV